MSRVEILYAYVEVCMDKERDRVEALGVAISFCVSVFNYRLVNDVP